MLFKLKADADAAAITAAFLGLKAAIPAIHEISFGAHRTFRRSEIAPSAITTTLSSFSTTIPRCFPEIFPRGDDTTHHF